MNRLFTLTIINVFLTTSIAFAQDNKEQAENNPWTTEGKFSVLLSQAAFSDTWTGGGISNYAIQFNSYYSFNYQNKGIGWTNEIWAEYGVSKTKDQAFIRKTNDRFEINSLFAMQMENSKWAYSILLNFKTQFANGFNFTTDAMGNEQREKISGLFAPAYLQLGPGLQWDNSPKFQINISPASGRFIFASKTFTNVGSNPADIQTFNEQGGFFGVEANRSLRTEFGASLQASSHTTLLKNVILEQRINLFSNYLEKPENVDLDYTATLVLNVNKYISTQITVQTIYDDNAVQALQFRQSLGLGFSATF